MQLSVLLMSLGLAAVQAAPSPMRARLSTVPIDVAMQETIAGMGAATATLAGTTLTLEGTLPRIEVARHDGARLRQPAAGHARHRWWASSHRAAARPARSRVRCRSLADQAAAYGKGLLYVQLQSEKAPDGNLRGWLMAPKGRR